MEGICFITPLPCGSPKLASYIALHFFKTLPPPLEFPIWIFFLELPYTLVNGSSSTKHNHLGLLRPKVCPPIAHIPCTVFVKTRIVCLMELEYVQCTVSLIACFYLHRVTGMVPVQEIVRYVMHRQPYILRQK